ncbi:MAG TPA: alpha/beta fold hydrolase [Bryobacteraceae bacterium]|jgi:pimeloyl-ACP methyl ester carboxylesterase|nr:alpha/beta fold hydrolase [Bryobacteraceae bacterium]
MRAFLCLLLPSAAWAVGACTSTASCTEWVTLAGGPTRSLVYSTYPLEMRNEHIRRALVMVHGANRDADNYFRTAIAAAFLAGALDDTIVIAPRFASNEGRGCADKLDANEVNWPCGGDSWRSGGVSPSAKNLTSYDLADEILRKLARKNIFPNLKAIVIAGHSAGGQFVTRYQMANKVHGTLGVRIDYVVSNPSSYAWPDAQRPSGEIPVPAPSSTPAASAAHPIRFGPFRDARNCTTYDQWPYGLKNRGGYTAGIPDEQLKKQLATRPATYLLGELDILPLGGFDSSCPAMAQGPTRLARGTAFVDYITTKYEAKGQRAVVIPLCGHNARCMFTAEPALPILFPKE